jgi:hypothetical protein
MPAVLPSFKTKLILGDSDLTIRTPEDGTGGVHIEGSDADGNGLVVDDNASVYDLTAEHILARGAGFTIAASNNINLQTTTPGGYGVLINSARAYSMPYTAYLSLTYSPLTTSPVVALPEGNWTFPFSIYAGLFVAQSGFTLRYAGAFTPNAVSGSAFTCQLLLQPFNLPPTVVLELQTPVIASGLEHKYTCEFDANLALDLTTLRLAGRLTVSRDSDLYIAQNSGSAAFNRTVFNDLSSNYKSSNTAVNVTTEWARLDFC